MGYVNAICPFRKRDVREITKRRVGKGGVEEIATIMPFAYLTFHLKSTDGGLEEIETTREFSFFLFALSLSLLFSYFLPGSLDLVTILFLSLAWPPLRLSLVPRALPPTGTWRKLLDVCDT